MRRLPPLNALRAFESAARHESLTRAAEELLVTQGAVSRQVQALEAHLGTRLFERRPRGIALTEAGRTLLPVLSDTFDRIARVAERLSAAERDLRVKVTPTFAIRLLIPRLHRFRPEDRELQVRLTTSWEIVDFAREDFDAAIVYTHGDWHGPGERADLIFVERMSVVCAPSVAAGGPPLRRPEDVARHRLLLNIPDAWDWRRWAERYGVTDLPYEDALVFDVDEHAILAAAAGHGVAIEALQMVEDDLGRGVLVAPLEVEPVAMGAYYLVSPTAVAEQPRVAAFRAWLLGEFGDR